PPVFAPSAAVLPPVFAASAAVFSLLPPASSARSDVVVPARRTATTAAKTRKRVILSPSSHTRSSVVPMHPSGKSSRHYSGFRGRPLARIELPLERLHSLGRRRGDALARCVAQRTRFDPWARGGRVAYPAVLNMIPHAHQRDVEVRELHVRPDPRCVSLEPSE